MKNTEKSHSPFCSIKVTYTLIFTIISININASSNMGETYNYFDSLVSRVTVAFENSSAIIERHQADIYATFYSSDRNRTISLHYSAIENMVRVDSESSGRTFEVLANSLPFYSTSWAIQQVYSLEKFYKQGRGTTTANLIWRNSFLVPENTEGNASRFENDTNLIAVTTEFPNCTAHSEARDPARTESIVKATFDTQIFDNSTGQLIGRAKWFDQYKTFAWKFPGSSGFASDETIPGGLPFVPNQVWANIQAFVFSQFHGSLYLNTYGCDGLHWLDNTIFFPCCEEHDLCYENDPANPNDNCTAGSWFFFGNEGRRWYCFKCNAAVVYCFLTLGGGGSSNTGGIGADPGVCFGEPGTTAWFVGCDPFAF